MAQTRDVLIEEIITYLIRFIQALQKRSTARWIHLDLSVAQVKTLLAIRDLKTSNIEQIASMLGVSQPTASHLVERVVQHELVLRTQDRQDRRRVVVRLTQAGEELLHHLLGSGGLTELSRRLKHFSEDELATCLQGMRTLISAMERGVPPQRSPSSVIEGTGGNAKEGGRRQQQH
ncbi:MAG TPA: MarR family winged helix-turn-helix transcriptional regulator [Ktedonobacteraceae bacterium]|nr:MarR family winged helix-turn-helix transcriptional regulator [Ktedonobacteraceae bacterium]